MVRNSCAEWFGGWLSADSTDFERLKRLCFA